MNRYGLIGRPLGHSASADYFAEKFQREGIADCRYDLFELASIEELPRLLAGMPDLCGFNVTIPYKQSVIPYLDALSDEARRVGAVNCVCCDEGRMMGYNTDIDGVRVSLMEFLGADMPEQALVLGTGGASSAVQYVLSEMGIGFDIVSRNPAKGNFTYDNLPCDEVTAHRLIINTTPVGMFPHMDEVPRIPYAFVTSGHYLFDLVYNPALTQFLDYGRQRGAHTMNGERMFGVQAETAWRIWNGR